MFEEEDFLPIAGLSQLLFCERRAALIYIEEAWSENLFTAEGTVLHEKVHKRAPESRGEIRITRGLRLRSLTLGLSGIADVIEFHRITEEEHRRLAGALLPGSAAFWRPFPVEFKRGELRHEAGYEVQLCAQAICIEEMLGCEVEEGAIFYGKTARRLKVTFEPILRERTVEAARKFHRLISEGVTPSPAYGPKCRNCSLADICIPQLGRRRNAHHYLDKELVNAEVDNPCENF